MLARNLIRFLILIIISLFLYSCPGPDPDPVILPGDITGTVTDAEASQPIDNALIRLMKNNVTTDSARTVTDGTYSLEGIDPGDYEIQASKYGYAPLNEIVNVKSTQTKTINFNLPKISTLDVSIDLLDFGLDSTTLKFSISKIGTGTLTYAISKSQNWITVSPSGGEITDDTDTITIAVNIDRTGLAKSKYKETIEVTQIIGSEVIQEVIIYVYLNGIWIDSKYVNIVRIGTQVWMGENLNVGTRIDGAKDQTDNGIIEKYCYNDGEYNCGIYGGLYQWDEMMQYNPAEDSGKIIGTTQGICPDGWHLPTFKELFFELQDCLGGYFIAGGKLKETGLAHWKAPNTDATNESGFTALPGGYRGTDAGFYILGERGEWWSTSLDVYTFDKDARSSLFLPYDKATFEFYSSWRNVGLSVRCVRD